MAFLTVLVIFGVLAWVAAVAVYRIGKHGDKVEFASLKADRQVWWGLLMLAVSWGPVLLSELGHFIFQIPYSERSADRLAGYVAWVGIPLTIVACAMLGYRLFHWAGRRVRELAR